MVVSSDQLLRHGNLDDAHVGTSAIGHWRNCETILMFLWACGAAVANDPWSVLLS